jgi:tRNA(Ile)-lysidine synthase
VLVAVSGGPDSVALLHVLVVLREALEVGQLGVAHLHHGIRGEPADLDQRFVAELASSLGLPFYTSRADVPDTARLLGRSVEDAARTARYGFLGRVARQHGYLRIAVGHTQDDQAETVLLTLLRGAGPDGLAGMAPLTGQVIRPLLEATRQQVMAYLCACGHAYRVDETNDDLSMRRNRVRHALIPQLMRDHNPNIRATLARTADVLREDEAWLSELTGDFLARAGSAGPGQGAYAIDRASLGAAPRALRRRAVRAAYASLTGELPCPLTLANVDDVLALLSGGRTGSSVDLPLGVRAALAYDALVIAMVDPADADDVGRAAGGSATGAAAAPAGLAVPGQARLNGWTIKCWAEDRRPGSYRARDYQWQQAGTGASATCRAWLSLDELRLPLTLRNRLPGDRFWPHGGLAGQKLKDFLIAAKIPRAERPRLPLLVDATGRIAAVLPLRAADWATVKPSTQRVLAVEATAGGPQRGQAHGVCGKL